MTEFTYIYFQLRRHGSVCNIMHRKSNEEDVLLFEVRLLLKSFDPHQEYDKTALIFSSLKM